MTRSRIILKLKGEDTKEFWENEKNPNITEEHIK